jgi:hypothetical protein
MATLYESLTILPLLRNLTTTASGRIDPPEPEFDVSRTSRVPHATGFRTMTDLICIV